MKRRHYKEEQIVSILKEHQAGMSVTELCRRHGIVEDTIYRWKSKYGSMDVAEAKRMRRLEQENARLKRLLDKAETDKAALKNLVEAQVAASA